MRATALNMPAGYTTAVSGRGRELERTFQEFGWAFLLSRMHVRTLMQHGAYTEEHHASTSGDANPNVYPAHDGWHVPCACVCRRLRRFDDLPVDSTSGFMQSSR